MIMNLEVISLKMYSRTVKGRLTLSSIVDDKSPLPPPGSSEEEDDMILQDEAYIDGPIKADYGTNIK